MTKINNYHVSATPIERTYLVGIHVRGTDPLLTVDESLQELKMLAQTAGMEVVGSTYQIVQKIESATFIGSGKVQEVIEDVQMLEAQSVIFDEELSPRHQRELEKRFGQDIKVIDRTTLILDIFAQHARTREGSLQVELAQYEYRLPRLTRQWTHLARQAGGGGSRSGNAGVGLRGPGETQLEVDRREIGRKIDKLKEDIERVRQHRERHRQQRIKDRVPVIALVGYTNAGKSTLFRALTGADVYAADQLFATLDPTTRRLELASGRHTVITDTVGFIQKLPTTLILAFRATLEEIAEADAIIHVVDLTHSNYIEQYEAVEDTLAELDVPSIPRILVGNKTDKLDNPAEAEDLISRIQLDENYKGKVTLSAINRQGIEALLEKIEDTLIEMTKRVTLLIPHERGDITSLMHNAGIVQSQSHVEHGVLIDVWVTPEMREKYSQYLHIEQEEPSDVQED